MLKILNTVPVHVVREEKGFAESISMSSCDRNADKPKDRIGTKISLSHLDRSLRVIAKGRDALNTLRVLYF